jgi:hypothetical protein
VQLLLRQQSCADLGAKQPKALHCILKGPCQGDAQSVCNSLDSWKLLLLL